MGHKIQRIIIGRDANNDPKWTALPPANAPNSSGGLAEVNRFATKPPRFFGGEQ